jgi:hypothetical protein
MRGRLRCLTTNSNAPVVCIQNARGSSPLSFTGQRPIAILKASEESQSPRTVTARRGHGEGSVYRDAANGTRIGAISLGWRPDGSRIRRKVTGRTKTEVREKLKKLQAEADAGLKTSASYTVAKAVDDWAAEASDGLADKLSGHMWTRLAAGPLWQDTGLVFTTSLGTPLDASHVRRGCGTRSRQFRVRRGRRGERPPGRACQFPNDRDDLAPRAPPGYHHRR